MVGDVAKLDMLNIATWPSYPVVGDVAKLDMLNIHGLSSGW